MAALEVPDGGAKDGCVPEGGWLPAGLRRPLGDGAPCFTGDETAGRTAGGGCCASLARAEGAWSRGGGNAAGCESGRAGGSCIAPAMCGITLDTARGPSGQCSVPGDVVGDLRMERGLL
eukprot:2210823-Rhodomonas_salina.2